MNINDIARLMNGTVDGKFNFNTEIKDTRGYLTVDSKGDVKNVGRHWWNLFSTPTDGHKNQKTRNKILDAVKASGVDELVVKKISDQLGIGDVETMSKPLSRRAVKQILLDIKDGAPEAREEHKSEYQKELFKYDQDVIIPKMKEEGVNYDPHKGLMFDANNVTSFTDSMIKFSSGILADVKMGDCSKAAAKTKIHEYCDFFITDDPDMADDAKMHGNLTKKTLMTLKKLVVDKLDEMLEKIVQNKATILDKAEDEYEDEYQDMSNSDLSDD